MRRRRWNSDLSLAEAFDGLRADYNAARSSRFRRRRVGVAASGSGADYHYRSEADFLRIMEQARDMDRNDVIVGQTVDRAVTNAIQDGIKFEPNTGDTGADAELAARWAAWSTDPEQCDLTGELTFCDIEHLVDRQVFVDGDHVVLPSESGALQLIEAHRLRTPRRTQRNVVHGVLLDDRRRRLEYWLTREEISPMAAVTRVGEMKRYPARDAEGHRQVFHVYNPKRASQTRGVSAFAPIFDTLGMFEDITFAKLVQQQVVSCFAIFEELEADAPGLPDDEAKRTGERSTESMADGATRTVEGISPGMRIKGDPGVKMHGFSPNVPNPEFFEHVRLILTLVGINLGLPLIMVLMDGSETNFSGWRGAVDQARLGFRRNQRSLAARLHRQAWPWKVRQWLSEDASLRIVGAKSTANIFGLKLNYPTWPYIQPLQDAQADNLRVKGGLTSMRRIQAERGRDENEVAVEIVTDNANRIRLAVEAAEEINGDHADALVDWRELLWFDPKAGQKRTNVRTSSDRKAAPAGAGG